MSREKARAALDKAWEVERRLALNKYAPMTEVERLGLLLRIYLDLAKAEMMEQEPQDFQGSRVYPNGWVYVPGQTPC